MVDFANGTDMLGSHFDNEILLYLSISFWQAENSVPRNKKSMKNFVSLCIAYNIFSYKDTLGKLLLSSKKFFISYLEKDGEKPLQKENGRILVYTCRYDHIRQNIRLGISQKAFGFGKIMKRSFSVIIYHKRNRKIITAGNGLSVFYCRQPFWL